MSVPRSIHHIWVGSQPVPERWANQWRRRHAAWSYNLWREADIEPLITPNLRRAWDYYRSVTRWHGMADIARIAILLRHGGLYVDIDSEPVRSFDDAPFMQGSFFAGVSGGTPEEPSWINNGTIGAEPGHQIMKTYEEIVGSLEDFDPPWRTVGAPSLTRAVLAHRNAAGVHLMPTRTFYPEGKDGRPAPGNATIYTRHYWATTHGLYRFDGERYGRLLRRRRGQDVDVPFGTRLRELVRRIVPRGIRKIGRSAVAFVRRFAPRGRGG